MKPFSSACSIYWAVVSLSLLCFLTLFPAAGAVADGTNAADIAKCIGYSLSNQHKEMAALENVSCEVNMSGGYMEDDFYLSGVIISSHAQSGGQVLLEGATIHSDPLHREIFNSFSLRYSTEQPMSFHDIVVEPINNEKVKIRFFFTTPERLSLSNLKKLSYLEAYERVMEEAIWFDSETAPDPLAKRYVVIAFQMNREASAKSLTISMTGTPGDIKKAAKGISRSTDGWLFAAMEADFAYNSGPGRFFNVVEHHPSGRKRLAAVFSNHSLNRRIESALVERGYVAGDAAGLGADGTARAIRTYQKEIGLHPDGEVSIPLLRLLDSPHIVSAVAEMQRGLSELGYDPGPVDGIMGPRSRKAIEAFQSDGRLLQDGLLTAPLLCRILDTAIASEMFPQISFKRGERKEETVSSYKEKMWPTRTTP